MRGIRFIPDRPDFDILGKRQLSYVFSALLIVLSVVLVMQRGLNLGVDFTGGAVMEIRTPIAADLDLMRVDLDTYGYGAVSVREFGAPDNLLIRIPPQSGGVTQDKLVMEGVKTYLDTNFAGEGEESLVDYRRTEFIGEEVGRELKTRGLYVALFSLFAMAVYIWGRFEWKFACAAMAALAYDVVVIIGFFALTRMEFNLTTVAAVMVIAGYSMNDTVIIFDRIREMLKKYAHMPLIELLNKSVNSMLARTIMTSVATLLAVVALYVFGDSVILSFVKALVVGIVIGAYSSVFIAVPVLLWLNIRRDNLDGQAALSSVTSDDSATDAGHKAIAIEPLQ